MINTIIIDDEIDSLEALKLKILKIDPEIKIQKCFLSAKDALREINDLDPDIVFLDIEMPVIDGFGFLEKIPNRTFEVIISTAHDAYAIQALKQNALDFLLKPVSLDELSEALMRFKQKQKDKRNQTYLNQSKLNAHYDKIPVPSMRGLLFLPLKEILYMVSEGNYTNIFLENKQKIISSKSIGDYELLLSQLNFFRSHHSILINLSYVVEYLKGEGGSVIMTDGTELDVSKRKKKEFLEIMGF
jgi:two-component system, LytTR family, response regulator